MANDGTVKIGTQLDDSGLKKGLSGLGSFAKSGAAVVGAAIASATAGMAALSKSALDSVASLEQNIGGVETLFKDSAQTVIDNAEKAYKTAGMSANEYMQSVTSFSASLLQSVGGDTAEAARVADMAMVDMSDNANKMGTDMASIQNAYQGFAKQNYTMLDNLKLGYGGTKTEMERLLADAEKLTGVKYDISNLSDVYSAIHAIQGELDITGTTAKEASSTIAGSIDSAKAAFDNFLNGSGSPEAFAESFSTAARNVLNALGEIIPRLTDTLPEVIGAISGEIPGLIISLVPALTKSALTLLSQVVAVVSDFDWAMAAQSAIDGFASFLSTDGLTQMLASIQALLAAVYNGLLEAIPVMSEGLFSNILPALLQLSESIRSNAGTMVDAGLNLILQLAQGLINGIPQMIACVPDIIINLAGIINDNAPKILAAGIQLIAMLAKGLLQAVPDLIAATPKIIEAIVSVITAFNWLALGKNVVTLLTDGIKGMASTAKAAGENIFESIRNSLQNLPSTLAELGRNAINSLGNGISGMLGAVKTAASGILNGILGAIKSLPSKLMQIAKDAVNKIVQAFTGESWRDIGSNILTGVAAGITGSIGKVAEAAKNAAKKAYESAKDFLDINSPSKLMRDMIGKNMIAGMETGIVSETPSLEKTSARSAERAVESIQGAAFKRSGVMADAIGGSNPIPPDPTGGSPVVVLEKGSIRGEVQMDGQAVGELVAPTVDIEIEKARKESER